MYAWIETCVNRERYKMYLHHPTLAQKHIDRSEELIRIIDEGYKLVQNQMKRWRKKEVAKSASTNQVILCRTHACTAALVSHVLIACGPVLCAAHR